MKIVNKYTTLLSLCAAFAACSDNEVLPDNPATGGETGEKTPIVLSVGGVDGIAQTPLTRASASAVITDGEDKTMRTFKTNTSIFMVMMSEYDTEHVDFDDPDNLHVRKFTVSRGDVAANSTDVVFDDLNIKYWDDAHARSSMITIWAFAQQGIPQRTGWLSGSFDIPNPSWDGVDPLSEYIINTYSTANTRYEWVKDAGSKGAIYPCINTWKTSHNADARVQDKTSVQYQDLLFTNNIADNTSYTGKTDGRLKFDFSTRKFPSGENAQLKFYHAMSKITIHIKKGEGFTDSDPFAFASGKNVKLSGLNTEGTFNIKEGEFQKINASYDITKIYNWDTPATGDAFTLEALAIPNIHPFMLTHSGSDNNSRFVEGKKNLATDVMMEFTIDNNKYQITSGQLFDALCTYTDGVLTGAVDNATKKTDNGTYIPLEAGKNYIFTFTIGKTKIKNISAQVADWEEVSADNINPSNARIKLQLEERGTAQTSDVKFYRASDNIGENDPIKDDHAAYNWKSGYSDMSATYDNEHSHWTTALYWDNNKSFYHFRSIKPAGTAVNTNAFEGDNVSLTSGVSYTDICWGAPMLDDAEDETPSSSLKWNYGPTANGFDGLDSKVATEHQIYKAIGPTEDPVKLIMFHMMSDVTFNIKTTTGTDAVTLVDAGDKKTKVEIVGFYPNGKVLLGNGLVKTTGDATTIQIDHDSESSGTHIYKYGVVPQDLATSANTNAGVQLRITTPDNNQYIVDLKDVKATAISTNNLAIPYSKNNDSKYVINRWYPGFKYVYSFTLKKTGIDDLKVTILDWETITADEQEVQIK